MSWLGRSLGQFGSEIGEGKDIALGWREREQAIKLAAARAQLEALMGPLQLQLLQEQLREAQEPRAMGTIGTPGGGTAGLTYAKGKYGTQQLEPGMDKNMAKSQIAKWVEAAPKEYKAALQSYVDEIDAGEDPQKAMEKASALMGQSATHQTVTGRLVKGDPVPDKNSITGYSRPMYDGLGNFVKMIPNIVIPGLMPREIQGYQITTDIDGNVLMVPETKVSKPAGPGVTPSVGGEAKIIGHRDTPVQRDAIKASQVARDSYAVWQVAQRDAKAVKENKNPKSSLALVFGAVRSMVAGAGRMTNVEIEQELKAGSYGQRLQRWYQQAATGTLPDDQVDQIMTVINDAYQGKREAGQQAWEYAYPGRPLQPWLKPPEAEKQAPPPPPPAGYVIEKRP